MEILAQVDKSGRKQIFFFIFIYSFERERQREHKQGERQREREKETPRRAGSPTQGSIPGTGDHDLS